MGKKNRVAVICGWLMFVVLSPGYALGQQQDLISLKVSDVPFVKVLEGSENSRDTILCITKSLPEMWVELLWK